MSNPGKMSRRDLIRYMGLTTGYAALASPLSMLVESVVLGVTSQAFGATGDKKYLMCQLAGAPPRWTMDLFLNPYDAAAITTNPHLATRFSAVGGRYLDPTYATVQRTDYMGRPINVPWMWQFAVPKSGGGTRPMDELLKHMVQLRGLNIGQGQHEAAQALHMHPLGAKQSLMAVPADSGRSLIPGINLSANEYRFASVRGLTSVNVSDGGDMVQKLMTPFISKTNTTFTANRRSIASAVEAASSALDKLATGKDAKAQALADNRQSAQTLLENGIAGMAAYWTPAVNRYKDLITRSYGVTRTPIAGFDDLPIGTTDVVNRSAIYDFAGFKCDKPDLRNMIVSSSSIPRMAEHFAFAEFVFSNELSNSVAINPDNFRGVQIANGAATFFGFDEHLMGAMTSLFFNTLYNRALSACMLELIDRLKNKNIFKDTVIDISAEFGRSTRLDGSGSDHGFQGGSLALYTGAVQNGPIVIGNIVRNDNNSSQVGSHGSWGYGARYASLNEVLHAGHAAATTAFLLGAPSPVTSATSLLKNVDGTILPVFDELPKQV